jgi:ATP-dependent Clp protease ATP-binding subunit ClpC
MERYDDLNGAAQEVMESAELEARELSYEYVGAEHILLALAKLKSGDAANVLRRLNLDYQQVRAEVEKLPHGKAVESTGRLPLTPRAKKILEHARHEAARAKVADQLHVEVGTNELLLGLATEEEGIANEILERRGVSRAEIIDAMRSRVLEAESPTTSSPQIVEFLLDPGSASGKEIGDLYFEISKLYKMMGGAGIRFTVTDCRLPEMSEDVP